MSDASGGAISDGVGTLELLVGVVAGGGASSGGSGSGANTTDKLFLSSSPSSLTLGTISDRNSKSSPERARECRG